MKSAIVDSIPTGLVYMDKAFSAINQIQSEYNWLITELNYLADNEDVLGHYIVNNDYIWMNGNDLTKILNDNWIPWIFAVFSAFNPCISLDDILKHELPFADGNGEFWKDNVTLQHPLADIEIVPWDGNHLLIISKDDSVVDQFMSSYSTAYDLQADNRKTNAQVKRIEDIVLASGNGQLIPQVCNTNLKWKIWHDIYKNATSEPNEKEILQSAIRLVNSN